MNNLLLQYYIPYESFDADMGGVELPDWAKAGSECAKRYAEYCGAEYKLANDRYFEQIDPRLDSLRIFYDPQYEKYDNILSLDLDMLIYTNDNIFESFDKTKDVVMVHETGVHTGGPAGWMKRVMDVPQWKRGIIAYGKQLFGKDWMFPKSSLYPKERFRYLNGGLQLWTKHGRKKAKEHFTSIDHYVLHTRYTEQMYMNLQLSQSIFNVYELDTYWNRMPYQWGNGNWPDGRINHFLARDKFNMPKLWEGMKNGKISRDCSWCKTRS
jgi:hypothetical protein